MLRMNSYLLLLTLTLIGKPSLADTIRLNKSPLNDTGITWHGLIPKGVESTCKAHSDLSDNNAYPQHQDCATGLDVLAENEDGFAGFRFRKLDVKGQALSANAKTWQCVEDLTSGLSWEVKTTQGLHSLNDQFTWYSSNRKRNGGHIGDWNMAGNHCHGYIAGKPATYCHTEQYVNRVNKKGLCGHNDWRIPSREELSNLIHFGEVKPSIDTHYFPNTLNRFYWSSSPTAGSEIQAWTISFEYGFTAPMRRTDLHAIRLVRTTQKE